MKLMKLKMKLLIKRLMKEEDGTETVEWVILAAFLLIAAGAAWNVLGNIILERMNAVIAGLG